MAGRGRPVTSPLSKVGARMTIHKNDLERIKKESDATGFYMHEVVTQALNFYLTNLHPDERKAYKHEL